MTRGALRRDQEMKEPSAMPAPSNPIHDQNYQETIEKLRKLKSDNKDLPEAEARAVDEALDSISEFETKLGQFQFGIAAFGEVNVGKSRLLNALVGQEVFGFSERGGETREAQVAEWVPHAMENRKRELDDYKLYVIDTPGIGEWQGEDRERLARDTVRYADIVLYVVAGDMKAHEVAAVEWLDVFNKPILLVLNQIDKMRPSEIEQARASIADKVGHIIPKENFVCAAGAPRPEMETVIHPDGRRERREFQPPPNIEDLQVRILEVIAREGKLVAALNASLFADDVSTRIAELKEEFRGQAAQSVIRNHMLTKALAVGANPIPILDIITAYSFDAHMIVRLGLVYGQKVDLKTASSLAREIIGAWGLTAVVELMTHMVASFLKAFTFAGSTILSAGPQALVAGWSSYVVGNAAAVYFRDGGWGKDGPKEVINRILEEVDRESILQPLAEKLRGQRVGGGSSSA